MRPSRGSTQCCRGRLPGSSYSRCSSVTRRCWTGWPGVLGAAPALADHLAGVPTALEGLLTPPGVVEEPAAVLLARRLGDARALEDVIGIARSLVWAEEFRLCVAQMQGLIDVDTAGHARTALAEATLQALLPAVVAEHARRYGTVRGGDMAVVALGKAGSREMMAGSDLDLMLLYSYPPQVQESAGGPKALPVSQWFIRLAHAFVAALTAPGAEGPLYAVDMRLRPSGNKGPVAVPLAGFERYHRDDAWTWERMALTRARVVAGQPAIRLRAERAIAHALREGPGGDQARADAVAMRQRLAKERPPSGEWDVKMRPGGGMEVEFIAQVLQLAHGRQPGGQNTGAALRKLAKTGALTEAEAGALIEADRVWRTVQSMVRITVGRGAGALPGPAEAALLAAVGQVVGRGLDRAALDGTLEATAKQVRGLFNHRIGAIE